MSDILYNIRMHASQAGRHISGAERIAASDKIERIASEFLARAFGKALAPDQITITVESLGVMEPRTLTALDLVSLNIPDVREGHAAAIQILQRVGVSEKAAQAAVRLLCRGAAPAGGNMRGAVIMDAQSGERLEPDQERGTRVSRFDWSEDAAEKVRRGLESAGLAHHRTREALALATKVAHAPGMVAELCWSDDPDYTAGYAASPVLGYVRFPYLKQFGDPTGGRVFFVNHEIVNLDALITYLETDPVLIAEIGKCRSGIRPDDLFGAGF
jgi:6-carboxyhexanoate--CoA ligase